MKNSVIAGITLLIALASPALGEEVLDLGEINILATRTNATLSDVSQGAIVIDEGDIRRSTATSLPELIGAQSGIFVSNYLGNPKGVKVDVRGMGETSNLNVLVLVDGRRTNQVDLSGVDWGQISLDAVKRVEVLKGDATVLYGDNASAGVVNIVTKKGYQKGEPAVKAEAEFGSYTYQKGSFSVNGTTQDLDYFFNYTNQQTNGYRVNNGYWANDFLGNATWAATDKVAIDLSTGYHRDRYGMPGALFSSDIASFSRRGSKYEEDKGWTSDVFVNLDPKINVDLNDAAAQVSFFNSFRERYNTGLNVSPWGRYVTAHHINTLELRPKFDVDSKVSDALSNHFSAGFDYFYAMDKVRSGSQGSPEDFVDIVKQTCGVYVLNRMELSEHYLLNTGGRVTRADYHFDQSAVAVNEEKKSITDGAMNFGLGYKYNKGSQVYVDYSRSFRLPATDEYYQNKYVGLWGSGGGLNTALKHQVAHNYELGIRDASLPWLVADMNVFLMDVKNEIYYDPLTFKNSNYSPLTRHWGFELQGKAQVFKNTLEPFVNWTWQDAFFKGGNYGGNKVPFVPRNKVASGISVNFLKNFKATFSVNYVGKCFAVSDLANTSPKLNAYTTFDLRLDYHHKNVKVWFAVKNIFDRLYDSYGVYSSSADEVGFYPAAERNFLGGVSLEF